MDMKKWMDKNGKGPAHPLSPKTIKVQPECTDTKATSFIEVSNSNMLLAVNSYTVHGHRLLVWGPCACQHVKTL